MPVQGRFPLFYDPFAAIICTQPHACTVAYELHHLAGYYNPKGEAGEVRQSSPADVHGVHLPLNPFEPFECMHKACLVAPSVALLLLLC